MIYDPLIFTEHQCHYYSTATVFKLFVAQGQSAMDKALAWPTKGRGSNPDTTKVYSTSIL